MSRLRGQALLVVSLPLVAMLLALLGVLRLERLTELETNLTASTDARLYTAELLLLRLVDAETGVRGYAATHERRFLDPYNASVAAMPKLVERLRVHRANARAHAESLAIVRAAESQMVLLGQIRSGVERGASALVPAALLRGKTSMDAIRVLVERYQSTEQGINAARHVRAAADEEDLRYTLGGAVLLAIAAGALTIILFTSRVVTRLAAVIVKTEDVAADRALGAPLRGNDEIVAVDRAVHRMAAAIRTREAELARYRLLAEITQDIILFLDRFDLTIIEANAAAAKAYGYERFELIGKPLHFIEPDDVLLEAAMLARTDAATGAVLEMVHRRSDGTFFPVEIYARGADVDGRRMLLVTARDITERRQAAEEFSLAQQRYHLLANVTSDMIVFVDRLDLTIIDANAAALAAYGYEREAFIGKSVAMLRPTDAPFDPKLLAIADSPAGAFYETMHQRSDGTLFPIESHTQTVDINGRRTIVATVRDISERRSAAEQVSRALDQAVEASRLKSEFVATMSHEIRTPMHGVVGMSELLLERTLGPVEREYAATIKESAQALLTIIDDILDFSRLEASKIELEAVAFNPAHLVASVVNITRGAARDKGLTLRSFASPHVPGAVRGDPTRVRQILINLVGNAVKFTATGGVTVSISVERNSEQAVVLEFAVSDTGIGVTPEARERLFDAFVQGDSSTTRRFGGTGLGLSISRRLVELMSGRIWLGEHEGPGSTFCFTASFEPSGESVGPLEPAAGALRVLVLDDDDAIRRTLEATLASWGMHCTTVADIAAARTHLCEAVGNGIPFDVVLIDYVLPRLDGVTFAAELAAHPEYGRPASILITAFDAKGRREAAFAAGCVAYFSKPIDPSNLYDAFVEIDRARKTYVAASVDAPRRTRILLAEDSALIRRVATFQLQDLHYGVDIVENGEQAVSAVAAGDYELVLMDMRMPEMDGITATRAIREAERENGRHVVIVALTANVLDGDRAACIAAGMDDFLAKPMQLNALRTVLERWLPERALNQPS